jgi:hypothetical protein
MDPAQTLHDFALNLLNDDAARSAFGINPEQVLAEAGLGDISAADVHEVVPLVLDYAQVDHLPVAENLTSGLTSGLNFDGGQAGAIEGLKALTQNFTATGGDTGLTNTLASGTALTQGITGDFSQLSDLTHNLDSAFGGQQLGGLTNTVTGPLATDHLGTDLTSHLGGDVAGHLGTDVANTVNTTIGHGADLTSGVNGLSSTVGDLTNSLHVGGVDLSHVGGVDAGHLVGDVTSHVAGATGNLSGTVTDVTSHIGDIASHTGDVSTGVSNIHDVVSNVGNDLGHVGDIGHIDVGGVLSGNDIHLSH